MHSKMDTDSRDSSVLPNNLVVEFRLKNGLCHSCGARVYEIGETGIVNPLTIPCVALEGRCLFCYPDNNDQRDEESPVRRKRRRRRSRNEEPEPASSSFSVVKAEPFDGVHASPHVHASPPPAAARFASLPRAGNEQEGVVEVYAARASNNAVEDEINMEITIQDADHNKFVGVVTEGTRKNGRGIFRFTHTEGETQGEESVYDGEFENGRMEGQGTIKDPATGCVYEGSFHRGAAHGYGVCTWLQGWKYEGEWVRDKREGKGRLSQEEAEDGEVYEGEWKKDQWHGKGVLKFNGGGRYVGDFKNHKLEGQGRYEFADGSVYEGTFKNDLRVGSGTMIYEDRTRYVGEWRNNWREGTGSLFHTDGSEFRGNFRGDEKIAGVLHLPDGIMRREHYVNGELQS